MPSDSPLALASRRVQLQIILAQTCRFLASSGPWIFAAGLLAVITWRVTGHARHEAALAIVLIAGWLGATAALAWGGRTTRFAALAAWDHAAGRKEAFASAYAFEKAGTPMTLGERLHIARAYEILPRAKSEVSRDLPVNIDPRAWLPALLFLGFCLTGLLRQPLAKEEQALSAEARARAAQTAGELIRKASLTDPFKGLTPEERQKAEELKTQLERTAKQLERLRQQTPREVLAELEKRAHEAEKLAGALAGEDLGGLSSELISELERNADTAEFGNALREGNLDKAAEEARKLSERLEHKDLRLEERQRLAEALKRSLAAASAKDRQSNLGQSLGRALSHLQSNQPALAGQQFSNLARQLATAGQRQNAQAQLRQLAGSLRAAGQRILGGQSQALQRLPQQAPNGMQSLGTLPMPSGPLAFGPGNPSPGSMPMGMPGGPPPGSSGPPPVPGMGPGAGMPPPGSGAFPMPGGGAPAPGAGAFPVPGVAAGSAPGGSQAGNGAMGYGNRATAPLAATKSGVVEAQRNGEGPSEVRTVEGQQHGEASRRSAQEVTKDFIKVEEQALSEEPLPLSRREQVLRYFTALRRQLDQPPVETIPP